MSFKDLNLNIEYNSEFRDVAKDFFTPVLKMSKSYKRVSAYYSSNSLIFTPKEAMHSSMINFIKAICHVSSGPWIIALWLSS